MRENEPVLLVLSVCDGEIILEKGEMLCEKCHYEQPGQHQTNLEIVQRWSLKLWGVDEEIDQRYCQKKFKIANPVPKLRLAQKPAQEDKDSRNIECDGYESTQHVLLFPDEEVHWPSGNKKGARR